MKTLSLLSLVISVGFSAGSKAAETASSPEDILYSAHKQLRDAGNYSWTAREGNQDRLTIRRARPNLAGKTQIDGFTLFVLPVRRGSQTECAALGQEAVYKVRGKWMFYSELNEFDREETLFTARIQSGENYLRPLPHELLAFALARARNIRKDANDIVMDVATSASLEGYILTGKLPRAGDASIIELRVGIENNRIVEFTLDFNPLDAPIKRPGQLILNNRYFWEISDIGTTTLKFEPGVDVMLETLRESTPARRR